MTTDMRKLPIGLQDFKGLREDGFLYVDKTAYVYRLATQGKVYFLGRPRRFGKSLLLSTMKAYFLGQKELFESLALAELDKKEWPVHPVFHIDLNVESYMDLSSLYTALDTNLRYIEEQWGKNPDEQSPAARLLGLIKRAYEQSGQRVVVLIDEYDKPLLAMLDNPEVNEEMRKILKGFYGVLKTADPYLRFAFLTGVTKFSKVSIFSDLNQLNDISLDESYAGICGITETELKNNFDPELHELAESRNMSYAEVLAEVKKRYDGYHFSEGKEDVYNPFSLLNTFSKGRFADYWFQTGTPTFLVKMVKRGGMDVRRLE
ncbi:MAG: AAA family ATPase, partial [Tannerella sp.]|nr:AAA family ATPase [Tannerella sp.]